MPAPQPESPPPEKMVRQLLQPDHSVGFFTELVERNGSRFQALSPIKRGTQYNATAGADQKVVDAFGNNLVFLKETVPLAGTIRGMQGDLYVIWHWATDHKADNSCNAKITYDLENVSYPMFARDTTVLRDTYEAAPTAAYGSALTALLYIKVTAGGTGYAATDTVNISGSHGGAAELVVDANGKITNIIVTNEGSGYDSASLPTISFTTTTGSGATAVAIVQPKTAVLVHQEKLELPDDDPYSHEFVLLRRIYKTLPGLPLTDRRVEEGIGIPTPYSESRQYVTHDAANKSSLAVSGSAPKLMVTTEYQQVSDVEDVKIVGTLSSADLPSYNIGPGSAGSRPFQSVERVSRNYTFPDEIRTVGTTIFGVTIQRSEGYSGPVNCLRARRIQQPATGSVQAVPSNLYQEVKWYKDNVAAVKTSAANLVGVSDVWATNALNFGRGINGALHDAINYGNVFFTPAHGDPYGLLPAPYFIGPTSALAAFVAATAAVLGLTTYDWKFQGLKFPATMPASLLIADIESAQSNCVADFGSDYNAPQYGSVATPVTDGKYVCIAVESQPWRFGCLLETFWFCKPVRSASDRDSTTEDGTTTGFHGSVT